MTINELYTLYLDTLLEVYDEKEAKSSAIMILDGIHGISRMNFMLNRESEAPCFIDFETVLERIKLHTPIQYIVGHTYFYSRKFIVDKSVLIPRPETEELVKLIIEKSKKGSIILDIGTGSGAIAISLAKEIDNSVVTALDISKEALEIAGRNSSLLDVDNIFFWHKDILKCDSLPRKYDVIVSNPPYICNSEKSLMRRNVLNHEPHLALFVEDNDPLIFYRKISQLAFNYLDVNGTLYFEINENFSQELSEMITDIGFKSVIVLKDLFDKPRILQAKI